MEKIGVADYGMYVWYGGYYDYDERLAAVGRIGFDGLERLYPTGPEDALRKASNLKKMGMGFATCNAQTPELSIRWTAALGGEYVWAEVQGYTFEAYLRQVKEQTKVAKKYGIEVAVHNHLGSKIETQEQLEAMLAECPDTKLLFDTGHLAVAGGDVEYIAKKYYDRIVAYHLKGWQKSDTPMPRRGIREGISADLLRETLEITRVEDGYVFDPQISSPFTPEGARFAYKPPVPFVKEEIACETNALDHTWTYLYDTVANGKEYPIKSEEALKVMEAISEIKRQNGGR